MDRAKIGRALIGIIVGLLLTSQSHAQQFNDGDIFAAVGEGQVLRLDQEGNLLQVLDTETSSLFQTGMCFDSAGNLYTTSFSNGIVTRFDSAGEIDIQPWGGAFSTRPESCVVDAVGNVYVGEVDGNNLVRKFSADGQLLASFSPATERRGIDWVDLSDDQCTLYYTSEGNSIKRFNLCTDQQLADFAQGLSGPCFALRIRSNGEVLVACDNEVYRLDETGVEIQRYTTNAYDEPSTFFALNLDPDGTSFWTAGFDSGRIYNIDIRTGALRQPEPIVAPIAAGSALAGLAVFGEITRSLADTDGDGILDIWEERGLDTTGDGEVDLRLSDLIEFDGISRPPVVGTKDVYVWVDWLEDAEDGHSHKPSEAALALVRDAFERQGIQLHIVFGDRIEETPDLQVLLRYDPIDHVVVLDEFNDLWERYFLSNGANPGRASVFHYAVFGHVMYGRFAGTCRLPKFLRFIRPSGTRPAGVNGFMVALQGWIELEAETGVDYFNDTLEGVMFMHELGHSLGLGHGGVGASGGRDNLNLKPNHLSVMNYYFGADGLTINGRSGFLDYSQFGSDDIPPLNENVLSETDGLNGIKEIDEYLTKWTCDIGLDGEVRSDDASGPKDWNCNDTLENASPISANINGDPDSFLTCNDVLSPGLSTSNEWENLNYRTGSIGTAVGVISPLPESVPVTEPDVPIDEVLLFGSQNPLPRIDTLAARAKSGKIQLIWSDDGETHNYFVYRREGSSSDYQTIAEDYETEYGTYLDLNVENGRTYCYRITKVTSDIQSQASNEACATPAARSRSRR